MHVGSRDYLEPRVEGILDQINDAVRQVESKTYRKSRYTIPEYLLNWPHTVQGECLVNQEKAKAITNSMIQSTQQEGVFLVSGNPNHSPKSGYHVNISQGQCLCAYFTLKKIPCKHMFAVFNHLPLTLPLLLSQVMLSVGPPTNSVPQTVHSGPHLLWMILQ